MWDSPLYAVITINEYELWAHSRAIGEQSQAGKTKLNAGREMAESERSHVALPETDTKTLSGKPQPRDNTQINKKWIKLRCKS